MSSHDVESSDGEEGGGTGEPLLRCCAAAAMLLLPRLRPHARIQLRQR